ncbi:MAG: GNAT family N-acetyltransferase, partial [Steroidobacteraceae bacterium]
NLQDRSNRYDGLVPANCQLLLGPRFALLRPEFAARRAGLARAYGQHSVVLFAGGGDPDNVTGSILEAWEALPPSRPALDVIVGAANPHVTKIRERCAALTNVTMHVHTSRMSELLAAADLLIGSAGTVSWERCCLGVPALMVVVADNQRLNARLLARHRTGINLGDAARLDHAALRSMIERVLVRPSLLRRMGERAADLVDGRGAVRAALILRAARMRLRQARSEDASVAWPWRNHPDTRRVSRDPRELTWDEHHAWWNRAVRDEQRKVFVAHCGSCDVGILRLDVAGDSAEISIYLDPGLTRLGLGVRILRLAQQWVAAQLPAVRRLDAYILRDNRASERTFAAAGFRRGEASWHWYRTDGSVRDANAGV